MFSYWFVPFPYLSFGELWCSLIFLFVDLLKSLLSNFFVSEKIRKVNNETLIISILVNSGFEYFEKHHELNILFTLSIIIISTIFGFKNSMLIAYCSLICWKAYKLFDDRLWFENSNENEYESHSMLALRGDVILIFRNLSFKSDWYRL